MSSWIAIVAFASCGWLGVHAHTNIVAQSARTEWGVALDGQRGFGSGRKLRHLERLLRSTDVDDKATFAALRALPGEVDALAISAAEQARVHKYTQILAREDPQTLEQLGIAFRESQTNIEARLERGNSSAVLARMLVDLRFRVRARVAQGLALEVRELSSALGLLGAQVDGYANLSDREVDLVARRADLAASRLRAMKLDLTALRTDAAAEQSEIDSAGDRERLLSALAITDHAQRGAELARVLTELEKREERAAAVLFTSLLEPKVRALVRARGQAIDLAAAAIENVRAAMPDTPEGRKAPPDLRELSKASRYTLAARAGTEALATDPMSDALCSLVAVSTDFQWGIRESRQWFDRYLALRGIRASDHRTYKDRQLTQGERRALEALQSPVEPPR
jgi:hypothetical protein